MWSTVWTWLKQQHPIMWPAMAGILGIFIGSALSMRIQLKLWTRDNKRSEYRKLLSTLTRSYTRMEPHWDIKAASSASSITDGTDRKQYRIGLQQATRVIKDRIFIAKEMRAIKLSESWLAAVNNFEKTGDQKTFEKQFDEITDSILKSAEHIIG